MNPLFFAAALIAVVVFYNVYRRYTRISLADIPGPDSPSFIMGNMKELYQGQAADTDLRWQAQYGNVVRYKGMFGEDELMISDPAALQYIYVKSGYRFVKQPERRVLSMLVNGKGIFWSDGKSHARQRKVMLPAFGAPECKAFLPLFQGCAESMCNKWMDAIGNSGEQSAVLNIPEWLSRATLDAIGEAAFDVRFGSINNDEIPLARTYRSMMADIFASLSDGQIFFQGISKYIPPRILRYLAETGNGPRLLRLREARAIAVSVAKEMVQEKAEMLLQGKGSRDLFSLLIKANMDAAARAKLTDEEMYSLMRNILFAGHETTSTTLTWALFELAKNPDIQTRLRAEIWETEATIHERGDSGFTIADFETMTYTNAVIKEMLRCFNVAYHSQRNAGQDDVLPLSQPITTRSGKVIHKLPISKGTRIVVSITAYNRNKELWGEDAHIFNPDRWLGGTASEKKANSLGPYSNLMTFLGGVRTCMGWRFAVIEFQAFLTEMIGKFEFSLTDSSDRIRREACQLMVPILEGELDKGVQLPLRVSMASRTKNRC